MNESTVEVWKPSEIKAVSIGDTKQCGGNITLQSRNPTPDHRGSIIFSLENPDPNDPPNEAMRFEADGRIFVRGKQIDAEDGQLVYASFKAWLGLAMMGSYGKTLPGTIQVKDL